jgi:hypothetical protein
MILVGTILAEQRFVAVERQGLWLKVPVVDGKIIESYSANMQRDKLTFCFVMGVQCHENRPPSLSCEPIVSDSLKSLTERRRTGQKQSAHVAPLSRARSSEASTAHGYSSARAEIVRSASQLLMLRRMSSETLASTTRRPAAHTEQLHAWSSFLRVSFTVLEVSVSASAVLRSTDTLSM